MIFSIIGASMVAVAICVILKKTNPEFSILVSLITGVIIFATIILNMSPFFDAVNKIKSTFNLDNIYIATIVKALGICYLTQLASETCKDYGYSSISGKVELAGKVTIILLALPMFFTLIEAIEKLIYLK